MCAKRCVMKRTMQNTTHVQATCCNHTARPTKQRTALQQQQRSQPPQQQSHTVAHGVEETATFAQTNTRSCSHGIIINHHRTAFTKPPPALQPQRNHYNTINGAAAAATILSTTRTPTHNCKSRCSHNNSRSNQLTTLQPQHHSVCPRGVSKPLTALQPQQHCHKTVNGDAATAIFKTTACTFA